MKVVSLALLYLGSVSFFGVEAAKLDIASDFKRKWSSWRARRDNLVALTAAQAAALGEGKRPAGRPAAGEQKPALTAAQAAALGEGKRPAGRPAAGEQKPALTAAQAAYGMNRPARSLDSLRAKRNQLPNVSHLREICGFGTCTVHNLAHLIHHYMDKDKDISAPPEKFGPQGYGRRRRRSPLDAAASSGSGTRIASLEHLTHHYLDKDKDISAPPEKLGPQGYGRRRRRSLLDAATSSGRSTRTASRLLASLREGGSARALAQQP